MKWVDCLPTPPPQALALALVRALALALVRVLALALVRALALARAQAPPRARSRWPRLIGTTQAWSKRLLQQGRLGGQLLVQELKLVYMPVQTIGTKKRTVWRPLALGHALAPALAPVLAAVLMLALVLALVLALALVLVLANETT